MENEPPTSQPQAFVTQPQPEKSGRKLSLLVPWLMVILLVAGIGAVYIWQHNKVKSLESKAVAVSTLATSPKPSTVSNSAQPYLYLYEYGLKIPLNNGIKDLYYVDQKEANDDVLWFSTQSIANADPGCVAVPSGADGKFLSFSYSTEAGGGNPTSVGGSPFGYVQIQNKQLAPDQVGTLDSQIGSLVAQANGYYLYFKSPQATCATQTAAASLISQQKSSFLTAIKNIQPIN